MKIGLALGSGVARGWAHIGVLRALKRAGIAPDIICGTSIGALVGAVHLRDGLDDIEDWARQLTKLKLARLFDFTLGHGGLIAGRRISNLFQPLLDGLRIEDMPGRFACVAAELGTGHEVWLQSGELIPALRASYALPGVFPPVKIEGRWLLDGALVNPVPVSLCRALGARLVIAVNLNGEAFGEGGFEIEDEIGLGEDTASEGLRLPGAGIVRHLLRGRNQEPSLFTVMAGALNIVQHRLTRLRLAGDPPDVTIAPKLGDIGLMQFDRADEVIAAGEAAAEQALPAYRAALKRLNGTS
jgi:NTE family protein